MRFFWTPAAVRASRFRRLVLVAGLAALVLAAGCAGGRRAPKPHALPIKPPPFAALNDKDPKTPILEIPDPPTPTSPKIAEPVRPPGPGNAPGIRRVTTPLDTVEPPPDGPVPLPKTEELKPDRELEALKAVYQKAADKYAGIDDYIVRFRRREFVNGKQQPEDIMQLKFKKPFMVHFTFLPGSSSEGRQIIYVEGKNNGKMAVKTGKGDPFPGIPINEDPKSDRATANCRRTIHDAGIGNLISRFGLVVADQEKGAALFGPLKSLGPQKRPESKVPMECYVQQLPAGKEPLLPKGGTRYWFFCADPKAQECGLPVLVITLDEAKREVEYYFYDRLQINQKLTDEEFDPAVVFKRK